MTIGHRKTTSLCGTANFGRDSPWRPSANESTSSTRQFRTDLDKLDHRPAMTGWISTSSIITLDRTCAWRNWASRHSAAGWGSEFDRRGHRR